MGSAIYIVTKKKIKGFDPFVNGKAIGKVDSEALGKVCKAAGFESLLSFISQDPDELAEFLDGEGIDVEGDGEFPAEEWFTPEQGLIAVRGLQKYLNATPGALSGQSAILEDLAEYEVVLVKLAEKRVSWHFAVDF
jgi:hypothetical protein